MRGQVDDVAAFAQHRLSSGLGSFCRLTKVASTSRMRQQRSQRDRPVVIVACVADCRTRPGRPATCRAGRGGLPRPARGARGGAGRYGTSRRNGVEPCSEGQRQAGHRAMQVECRQRCGRLRQALRDAGQSRQQRTQRVLDDQNDARAARRELGHVARELNRIAQPFVGIDQDGLALDVGFAEPSSARRISGRCFAGRSSTALRARPSRPRNCPSAFAAGPDSSRLRHCRDRSP